MAHYIHYWKLKPVGNGEDDRGGPVWMSPRSASRLDPRDVLWAVTLHPERRKRLKLVARVVVDCVTESRPKVIKWCRRRGIFDYDFDEDRAYVLSKSSESRSLPLEAAIDLSGLDRRLHFESSTGKSRLPAGYTGQHLQSMRRLTDKSAQLLEDEWDARTEDEHPLGSGEPSKAADGTDDADGPLESEGEVSKAVRRCYKRSLGNRSKKLEAFRKKNDDRLYCECCDFDYAKTYGEWGKDFIVVHHTRPVSQLSPNEKQRLSDLRLVCDNCHRMIHRRKHSLLSIDKLRGLVSRNRRRAG